MTGGDPDIKIATSLIDFIFRKLKALYLDADGSSRIAQDASPGRDGTNAVPLVWDAVGGNPGLFLDRSQPAVVDPGSHTEPPTVEQAIQDPRMPSFTHSRPMLRPVIPADTCWSAPVPVIAAWTAGAKGAASDRRTPRCVPSWWRMVFVVCCDVAAGVSAATSGPPLYLRCYRMINQEHEIPEACPDGACPYCWLGGTFAAADRCTVKHLLLDEAGFRKLLAIDRREALRLVFEAWVEE